MNFLKNRKSTFKLSHYANYIVVAIVFAVFFALYSAGALSKSAPLLINQIAYSIILAVSLNLVVGFLGELSLGHAGFMCIGAYLGMYIANAFIDGGMSVRLAMILSVVIGGAVAAIFGFIVGLPALRLRGDYLAIVTLAFGEIVRNVCRNIPAFGGAKGLESSAYVEVLRDKKLPLFFYTFIILLFVLMVVQNLIRSKHGRAITAIRDNEIAAKSMGTGVTYYKLMVFVISAFFAGMAGVIYGASVSPVMYSSFSYNYSIEILVMVVLGGMGSINGSIIAATVITVLNHYLKAYLTGDMAAIKTLVYALILIIMVIYKNAPALKQLRERYNFKNFVSKFVKKNKAALADDDARWDVVPTKIEMNEVLSTDFIVIESTKTSGDKVEKEVRRDE